METNSPEPTAPDLFISYARADRERVQPLADALIAHGWTVWWDLRIRAGEQFHTKIEEALSKSACVIVVWSKHSIASRWVIAEADEGANRQILVPVLLDQVPIPIAFRGIHTADFVQWSGNVKDDLVQALVQDISAVAGEPQVDAAVAQQTTANTEQEVLKVQGVEEDEIEQLEALRREVLMSMSPFDLKRAKYEIDNYLVRHPYSVEARILLDQLDNARSTATPPLPYGGKYFPGWQLGAVSAVFTIIVVASLYVNFRPNSEPDELAVSAPAPPAPTPPGPGEPDGSVTVLTTAVPFAPEMVLIPAGTFQMGSNTGSEDERPVHEVAVTSFELARNELTWAEWQLCEDEAGCNKIDRPSFFKRIDASEQPRHPVVNVNIDSVNEYLTWINKKSGRSYRLPSEAEWEYATRAGSTTNYYWGNAIGENRANCDGCGSQWDIQSTAPVGSFDENPFGLNDVHGNVWEWTADCWHDSYEGAPSDGSAWLDNCSLKYHRPLRGGSWFNGPVSLRAANRNMLDAGNANGIVGFRLARTLP